MSLKEWFKERFEKNAVKSILSWENIDGNRVTEVVYMKRSRIPLIGDWSRIYPPVNENNSWNYSNLIFGGYKNLIKLLLLLVIIGLLFYGVADILNQCKTLTQNICVQDCINAAKKGISYFPIK